MSVNSINSNHQINALLFKSKIQFVVNDKVKARVVDIESNKVIREVPPSHTSQILNRIYG